MIQQERSDGGARLCLHDVRAGFGGTDVLRVSELRVNSGELVSLVGPSGCGKSTLLRIVAGLLPVAGGQLEVQPPVDGSPLRVGFVFQEATLLPWRTAEANIRLPGQLERQEVSPSRVRELAELIGLDAADLAKRPAQLSGGMKMRVSLARALSLKPHLLLLDEPFAALDDLLRQQLQEDVVRIQQELGVTTLMVTHNVSEAVFMSRRVVTLGGSPAQIIAVTETDPGLPRNGELRDDTRWLQLVRQVAMSLRQDVLSGDASGEHSMPSVGE